MKTIGILTFHRSYNYGAFIQSYSLSNRIAKEFPNCKVDIIDYSTKRMTENYPASIMPYVLGPKYRRNTMFCMIKQLGKYVLDPACLDRKRKIYQAFNDDVLQLPLSDFHIINDEYEDLFKIIDKTYDVLIVGSDAVWEYKTYPFPNAYYPNYGFKRTKLISFAASSGRMRKEDLSDDVAAYIKSTLDRFSYIGIRDISTQNFIQSITNNLVLNHNCDPTAFLDFASMPRDLDRVNMALKEAGIDFSKPIIGLMGNNEICNYLRKLFGTKYQIVSVYQYCKTADYNFTYLTPFEWARIFSLFRVTVTKYFHGSMLSLKNGTPTIAVDTWETHNNTFTTKIADLYTRLELEDHYFRIRDLYEKADKIKKSIEDYIAAPDTEKILRNLNQESHSFDSFRNALQNALTESELE